MKRAATEGRPYSYALENLTFEAKPSRTGALNYGVLRLPRPPPLVVVSRLLGPWW